MEKTEPPISYRKQEQVLVRVGVNDGVTTVATAVAKAGSGSGGAITSSGVPWLLVP